MVCSVYAPMTQSATTDFDEDWFAFNASADDVITVQVQIADGSALSRPLVEVVDLTGHSGDWRWFGNR